MPRPRLYHPDYGWGDVVRMSADGHLLVNFPSPHTGRWVNPASQGITLEGASALRALFEQRPKHQWGYCWNCNSLTRLERVPTSSRSGEGYLCACGAVSKEPYSTCRDHGASCTLHPPVDPDGDPLPEYQRSPGGLWRHVAG